MEVVYLRGNLLNKTFTDKGKHMAYLISDMAEGSKAALQMQQNFAAAPDVQQAQANFMQEQQFKLQQEQANLEKTRLNSMVAESGFKATQDSKFKLQALTKSSDWQTADDAARLRMVAAVQMESGDVDGGAKTLASSEIFDAKKLVAEQKRLDQQAQVIGNAYGVIDAMPDDQVNEFVNRLPKPQQDALISQVGKENWEAMNGTQKKEATRNLMMNAKGQLAQLKFEADEKKQKAINASRERVAEIQALWHKAVAAAGIGNKSGATKEDTAQTRLFFQQQNTADRANKSRRLELDTAVNDAKTQVDKDRLFGNLFGAETEAKTKLDRAIEARTAFEVEAATKAFDSASLLPDGTTKTRILAEIKRRVTALGVVTPDDESADNSEPQDSNAKTANVPPVKGVAVPGAASTSSATPAAPAAAAVPSNTATPAATPTAPAAAAPAAAPVVLKASPEADEAQIATVVAAQKALKKNPASANRIITALNDRGIPYQIVESGTTTLVPTAKPTKPVVVNSTTKAPVKTIDNLDKDEQLLKNLGNLQSASGKQIVSAAQRYIDVTRTLDVDETGKTKFRGSASEWTKYLKDIETVNKMSPDVRAAILRLSKKTEGTNKDEQTLADLDSDELLAANRFIKLYKEQGGKVSTQAEYAQAMKDRKVIEALSNNQQAAIERLARTVKGTSKAAKK